MFSANAIFIGGIEWDVLLTEHSKLFESAEILLLSADKQARGNVFNRELPEISPQPSGRSDTYRNPYLSRTEEGEFSQGEADS